MATDTDELLIFKLRGMEKPKKQQKAEEVKPAAREEVKQTEPRAIAKPVIQKLQIIEKPPERKPIFSSIVESKPEPQPQKIVAAQKPAPQEAMKAQAVAKPKQPERFIVVPKEPQAQEKKPYFGEMFTKPKPESATLQDQGKLVESMKRRQEVGSEAEGPIVPAFSAKPMSGKESIEEAKGRVCTNHPWRGAYAVCEFCRRPFCYADMIEYGKHFYCLEDIDKATSGAVREKAQVNIFTRAAGVVFIIDSLLLLYFTLPQLEFIGISATKLSSSALLAAIGGNYSIPLLNALLSVMGILAAILLFISEDQRAIYLAGLVAAVVLIGVSYEYLNSYLYYTLLVSVIALVEIMLLTFGRVSSVTTSYSTDLGPPDVEWPRLETF